MQTNQARRGLLLIVLAAVMWGTVGVATKYIYRVSDTNALSIGFFRLLFSAPILLGACWFMLGRHAFRIPLRDLGFMALMGGAMALYQVCYFAAIARVGVAVAVLITLCTAPVMVALLSAVLLRERLSRPVLLALCAALLGTGLLIMGGGGDVAIVPGQTLIGVLLALASAFGYTIITLCSRALAGRYHPLQPIAIGFVAGALFLLPFALAAGLTLTYPLGAWLALVHLGLIPTALAYVLFLSGMRHTPATVATIATLIEPLTSTALAWLFFREKLGSLSAVGAVLLLAAIGVLYVASARQMPAGQTLVPGNAD